MIRFRELFTRRQTAGRNSLISIRNPFRLAAKCLIALALLTVLSGCHKNPLAHVPPDVIDHVITEQWAIIPNRIVVHQGQVVEIVATSPDVEHGLQIKGYGIRKPVQPGEPTIIKFRATKTGTFLMRCDILCGRGHDKMRGQLVVLPALPHTPAPVETASEPHASGGVHK